MAILKEEASQTYSVVVAVDGNVRSEGLTASNSVNARRRALARISRTAGRAKFATITVLHNGRPIGSWTWADGVLAWAAPVEAGVRAIHRSGGSPPG